MDVFIFDFFFKLRVDLDYNKMYVVEWCICMNDKFLVFGDVY